MLQAENIKGEYLSYRGYPLVRKDNELYLGDLSHGFYIYMLIMNEKHDEKLNSDLPAMIMVQLIRTGSESTPERQTVAQSLADALETGIAWLERTC